MIYNSEFCRRSFLRSSIAAGSMFPSIAACQTHSPQFLDEGDDFLRQLMISESDQAFEFSEDVERTLLDAEWEPLSSPNDPRWDWWSFPSDTQTPVSWGEDRECLDYQPLLEFGTQPEEFSLTHDVLERLVERNSFNLGADRTVIIGLRGTSLATGGEDSGWVKSVRLRNIRPDHKSFKCLMGAWDRSNGQVRVFKASTVPEVNYMWSQARLVSGANLMPTGLYRYKVGPHGVSTTRSTQVGALRLSGHYFEKAKLNTKNIYVLRTLDDLKYSIDSATELWDICEPHDNIHASVFGEQSAYFVGSKSQAFSSAGCQVVPGGYELFTRTDGRRAYTTKPIGLWRDFRASVGLDVDPKMVKNRVTRDDGKGFYYMLLTGADFALAAEQDSKFREKYYPLRPGSSGERVEILQEIIGTAVDGNFGAGTAEATVYYAKVELETAQTPIVSNIENFL